MDAGAVGAADFDAVDFGVVGVVDEDAVHFAEVAVGGAVEVAPALVFVAQAEMGQRFAALTVHENARFTAHIVEVGVPVEVFAFLLPVVGDGGFAHAVAEDAGDFVVRGIDGELFADFQGAFAKIKRRPFFLRGAQCGFERGGAVGRACRVNAEFARINVFAVGRVLVNAVLHGVAVAFRRFRMAAVVGVAGFDGDGVTEIGGGEGIGFAAGVFDGDAVPLPLVLYVISGETVAVLNGRRQSVADARLARDADFARMVRLRVIGDCGCRRAGRGFVVAGVVFVAGFDADVVSRVGAGELVGCSCLSANRLAVAQPLVLHVIGDAVVIANGSGQRLSDFGLAADADFARVVGLRLWVWIRLWVGLRIRCRGVGNRRCCLA